MDRQATFLLALGLLIAAAAFVSASGWILLVRDRRADRSALPGADSPDASDVEHSETAETS
jgi:hypothetical protein